MRRVEIDYSNTNNIINNLRSIVRNLESEQRKIKSALSELYDLENYYYNKGEIVRELEYRERQIYKDIENTETLIENINSFTQKVEETDKLLGNKFKIQVNSMMSKDKLIMNLDESNILIKLKDFIFDGGIDLLVGLVNGLYSPAYIQELPNGKYRIVGDTKARAKVGINATGATYTKGSISFIDAGLDKYLPKGASFSEYIKKFTRNANDAIIKSFDDIRNILNSTNRAEKVYNGVISLSEESLVFQKNSVGSYKTLGNVGKALGYLSIGIETVEGIDENIESGESSSKIIGDVIADTSAGIGSMVVGTGCAKVGAALGTLIPIPGVGTAVGAVAGFAAGYVGANLFDKVIDDDIKEAVGNGISTIIDRVGEKLEDAKKAVGNFVDVMSNSLEFSG